MSKIQRYGGDTMLFADDFGDIVIYEDHAAIVAQLEADLAAAKKDQSRYQWLLSIDGAKWISLHQLSYAQLDTYIDAAIAAKEQQ